MLCTHPGSHAKEQQIYIPLLFTLSFMNLENITKCLYSVPTFEVIVYLNVKST